MLFAPRRLAWRLIRSMTAPVGGGVYIAYWLVAEWGRASIDERFVVLAFGAALGLSVWMPITALALSVAVPLLQAVGLFAAPTSTSWPEYIAIALVAGVVGAGRSGILRYVAIPVAGAASVAAAWAMTVPTPARSDVWASWTDTHAGTRSDLVTVTLALVGVAGIGWAVGVAIGSAWRMGVARGRLAAAEQEADEAAAELQIALDRAAIARDVHDSLAHSLAIVVSLAQGAAALAIRDEIAAQALRDIAAVSREALTDVRALVERIEDESPGRHGIDDIEALVQQLREVGMTASLTTSGEPTPLGRGASAAAYRIVQESCTNGLKHAGRTATVSVILDWRGPGLAILVESRGDAALVASTSPGVGVRGMRERARLAGGWLRAGREDDGPAGSWVVTAWLPDSAAEGSAAEGAGAEGAGAEAPPVAAPLETAGGAA